MAELNNFVSDSIAEFFGMEDELHTPLSSVDQQELDSMLQSSKATAQPQPLFSTATTGDLKRYKAKTRMRIYFNMGEPL